MKKLLAHRFAPDAVLMLATALWGLAFLVTRAGVSVAAPAPFVALRFATAALAIRSLTGARLSRVTPTELRGGALIALAMLGGYVLSASALRSLGAGHVAFISALYVPLVPVLQFCLMGILASARVWMGVAMATVGLVLIGGGLGGGFSRGDALALGGACGVSAELLLMARFAPRVDARRLAVVECIAVSFNALLIALSSGQRLPPPAIGWVACALGLGAASAFLQVGSNWGMSRVPVHRAMLIFATEPVWAGVFGAVAGERMSRMALAGAALIVGALVLNGSRPRGLCPPGPPAAA